MNRRYFISSAVAIGTVAAFSRLPIGSALFTRAGNLPDGNSNQGSSKAIKEATSKGIKKVTKTNTEWKSILTPEQYNVTREKGTERPFTSPLNDIHDQGIFECVSCGLPLFDSKAKFDSGTGWPSFYEPIAKENVQEEVDNSLGETRTEVQCAQCDAHLGHVFPDGPKPTGLRYCMNGVALKFVNREPRTGNSEK